jgi:hypothetical protein
MGDSKARGSSRTLRVDRSRLRVLAPCVLAITWYEWYLAAHVIAAVLWVGGGAMLLLLAILTRRENDPVRLAKLAGQVAWLGVRYFAPLSLITVAFGFGLVERGDLGYDQFFIRFGIAG